MWLQEMLVWLAWNSHTDGDDGEEDGQDSEDEDEGGGEYDLADVHRLRVVRLAAWHHHDLLLEDGNADTGEDGD